MSIEREMYSILKKGSSTPIIFIDMDDTILIRDVDLNFFLSKINGFRKNINRLELKINQNIDIGERRMKKLEQSKSLVGQYDKYKDNEFYSGTVSFFIRPNICDLINGISDLGDVYILTASKNANAQALFEFLKGSEVSEKFPCFSKIKGLISSINDKRLDALKHNFSEEDVGKISDTYYARPYVLIDNNNEFAVESKHILMSHPDKKDVYRDFKLNHIQVPNFIDNLEINANEIIEEAKRKIQSQRLN